MSKADIFEAQGAVFGTFVCWLLSQW